MIAWKKCAGEAPGIDPAVRMAAIHCGYSETARLDICAQLNDWKCVEIDAEVDKVFGRFSKYAAYSRFRNRVYVSGVKRGHCVDAANVIARICRRVTGALVRETHKSRTYKVIEGIEVAGVKSARRPFCGKTRQVINGLMATAQFLYNYNEAFLDAWRAVPLSNTWKAMPGEAFGGEGEPDIHVFRRMLFYQPYLDCGITAEDTMEMLANGVGPSHCKRVQTIALLRGVGVGELARLIAQ